MITLKVILIIIKKDKNMYYFFKMKLNLYSNQ